MTYEEYIKSIYENLPFTAKPSKYRPRKVERNPLEKYAKKRGERTIAEVKAMCREAYEERKKRTKKKT